VYPACGVDVQGIVLLRWIASLGAVTSQALARREGTSINSARGRLRGLQRKGTLAYTKPATAVPGLFAITGAGLSAAWVAGLHRCTVAPSTARHYAECALVAVELELRLPGARVIGERELRRDERRADAALASAQMGTAPDGKPRLHRPDLVVWRQGGAGERPLAIEVELSLKTPPERAAIVRAWRESELVAGALYVVAPRVQAPLRRTIDELGAGERVTVVPLASLTRPHLA
jgi:hypothetical protein